MPIPCLIFDSRLIADEARPVEDVSVEHLRYALTTYTDRPGHCGLCTLCAGAWGGGTGRVDQATGVCSGQSAAFGRQGPALHAGAGVRGGCGGSAVAGRP